MTQTFSIKGLTSLAVLAASTALTLGTPALADKASNTLNVAFAAEPEPLDTYKIAGRQGLILARHIYDGLLYKNLDTGEIVPALAESWEFTGPLTMEFTLRQGVKFHNGVDFTADDVVEKLDDYKVRINMSKPFAGAVEMLADALPIYPHAFFAENGSAGMSATPIGTGPYKLISQEPGIRYEMERFEDHYEGSPKSGATIDKISVRTIPEMNTQYAELMSGSLDWIWRIPPDQASRLEGRVRQALIHATNRGAIVDAFAGGASEVLNTPCNPAQFGCEQDVTAYEYDPEKAKALLAEAGYEDGFKMEMVFAAMPRPTAEAVAADLANVGVTLELNEPSRRSPRKPIGCRCITSTLTMACPTT